MATLNRVWSAFKSHPYITNVVGYTALFASADLIQQSVLQKKWRDMDSTVLGQDKQHANTFAERATAESGNVTPDKKIKQERPSSFEPQKWVESDGSNHSKTSYLGMASLSPQEMEHSSEIRTSTQTGINWSQTARVALVGFSFHANFNYHWLKGLERMLPGTGAKRVLGKVLLDQLIAAPATISAFYIGLSALEGRQDLLEDWQEKFWTSYKTGVVYWSTMQAVNFSLVPPVARTVFVGGVALVWTVFLCHFRQQRG